MRKVLPTRRRAFSLLEMALVLAISGIMIAYVLHANRSASIDCNAATKQQLQKIREALDAYPVKNNRMPYPAMRNLGVEDPNYGREAAPASLDGNATFTFGALPFETLGLPASYAGDCWGNKFTYVVTNQLTNPALMGGYPDVSIQGLITVKSTATNTLMANAAYAVISHGADGFGAVKINYAGASHGWCSGTASLEAWNCNPTAGAVMDAVFNDGKNGGALLDDDLITYHARQMKNGVPIAGVCGPLTGGAWSTPSCICANAAGGVCGAEGSPINATNLGTNCGISSWQCPGSSNGGTTTCTANNPCAGACGGSTNSCTAGGGYAGDGSDSGCNNYRRWTCLGSYHGANAACSIYNGSCASCGSPCSGGSLVNDNGQYSCGQYHGWGCSAYGGSYAGCSSYNGDCPVNGSCGGGYPACNSGNPGSGSGQNGCGTWDTWGCYGYNGGGSVSCAVYEGDCAPVYQWIAVGGNYCPGTGSTRYCDLNSGITGTGNYVCATIGWYFTGATTNGGTGCSHCSVGWWNGAGNNPGAYTFTAGDQHCGSCNYLGSVECRSTP
jgi:prepilin-type N-terminal cleavage/methylation domain-containing protein